MSDDEYDGFGDDGGDEGDWQGGQGDEGDWQEGQGDEGDDGCDQEGVDDSDGDEEDIEQETEEDEIKADDDREEEKPRQSCHQYPQCPAYVEAKMEMKMSNMRLNENGEENKRAEHKTKQ